MKTLLHIAIIACVACACQEQKPQGYTGNNTIIFYTDNLEDEDQITQTFYWAAALNPDSEYNTCWVDVATVGDAVDYDRELKIVQDTAIGWNYLYDLVGNLVDSTSYIIPNQAVEGRHYVPFDDEGLQRFMVMPANTYRTQIPIVMRRDPDNNHTLTLEIRLVDTPTAKIGESRLSTCQITIE